MAPEATAVDLAHQPTERIVGKGLAMLDVFDTQEAQTAVNIRERAGKRKEKYVTSPESPSKRLRCLFGIQVGLECPRGLEGHLALSDGSPSFPSCVRRSSA